MSFHVGQEMRHIDELLGVPVDRLFTQVDSFTHLMEYASQDSDPKLFEPYRKPIHDRAAAFKNELLGAEPKQIDAVIEFAARAYRRPLTPNESIELRGHPLRHAIQQA